jgi:hypothetical protein
MPPIATIGVAVSVDHKSHGINFSAGSSPSEKRLYELGDAIVVLAQCKQPAWNADWLLFDVIACGARLSASGSDPPVQGAWERKPDPPVDLTMCKNARIDMHKIPDGDSSDATKEKIEWCSQAAAGAIAWLGGFERLLIQTLCSDGWGVLPGLIDAKTIQVVRAHATKSASDYHGGYDILRHSSRVIGLAATIGFYYRKYEATKLMFNVGQMHTSITPCVSIWPKMAQKAGTPIALALPDTMPPKPVFGGTRMSDMTKELAADRKALVAALAQSTRVNEQVLSVLARIAGGKTEQADLITDGNTEQADLMSTIPPPTKKRKAPEAAPASQKKAKKEKTETPVPAEPAPQPKKKAKKAATPVPAEPAEPAPQSKKKAKKAATPVPAEPSPQPKKKAKKAAVRNPHSIVVSHSALKRYRTLVGDGPIPTTKKAFADNIILAYDPQDGRVAPGKSDYFWFYDHDLRGEAEPAVAAAFGKIKERQSRLVAEARKMLQMCGRVRCTRLHEIIRLHVLSLSMPYATSEEYSITRDDKESRNAFVANMIEQQNKPIPKRGKKNPTSPAPVAAGAMTSPAAILAAASGK